VQNSTLVGPCISEISR